MAERFIKHNAYAFIYTQGTYLHFIFQVCANGLVKFDEGNYEIIPRNFGTFNGQRTSGSSLAPYWSFVDLDYFESGHSRVFYRKYGEPNNDFRGVFAKATAYGNRIFQISDYSPSWVTVITWVDLRPKQPGFATYEGVSIN